MLVKDGKCFRPAALVDQEIASRYSNGEAVRFTPVKVKKRSLEFHRLYWAGLIELTYSYWNPSGGLITPDEKKVLMDFAGWLDEKGKNSGAIRNAMRFFLTELRAKRTNDIETPSKSKYSLHTWIKIEAGYFEWELTPHGMVKKAKSINFNSMNDDEFSEFYKDAFAVCWRFILSRSFSKEDEVQNAVSQLLMIG